MTDTALVGMVYRVQEGHCSTLVCGTAVANKAFAVLTPVGGTAGLYNIELTTGRATLINTFLSGDTVVDLAIPLDQR